MRILPAGHAAGPAAADAVDYRPKALSFWRRMSRVRQILALTGLAAGLGLLVAANLQTKPAPTITLDEFPRQIGASTIERLEAEQADLKRQIAELRRTVGERQEQAVAAQAALGGLNGALADAKSAAGMTALKGPGLKVVLDDSAIKSIPANEDPALYIVHEFQLRDVVNLLWSANAEAIAINNERLVSSSSIYCVGSTILVNNTRLSAPYELSVIGDGQALEEALANPANLKSLKTRVKVYGLQFKATRQREVAIPAFDGSVVIKYASLVR